MTAIDRSRLSQPVHLLARHDYLSGDYSFLDYGCGKGDDIRELEAHGLNCSGWDPLHHPEGELVSSDIVNLGFVLNVIEEKNERSETLRRAFEYCDKLLIVSVMIANDSHISKFTPYKDGVITSIKTFQKYYAQSEIKYYLESVLSLDAIPISQGIFIIFKDKLEEQLFLSKRQHIKRDWKYKTQKNITKASYKIKENIVEKNIDLFTDFWETSLDLGRVPANDEFEFTHEIRKIAGSHARAHNSLIEYFGEDLFKEAAKKRKDDLLVYFSLGLFEKRKSQSKLPLSLQRDIKIFFSNYKSVIEISNELLFSVSNTEIIENACLEAHEKFNCGYLESGHSYTFHKSLLSEAPIVLRVYVGCAIQLHGDLENIQLIKAHFTSGKVSLMGYSDWDTDTPHLIERVKIKMREQDVDYFDYIDTFTPPPLLNKKDFFDKKLFQELGIIF